MYNVKYQHTFQERDYFLKCSKKSTKLNLMQLCPVNTEYCVCLALL